MAKETGIPNIRQYDLYSMKEGFEFATNSTATSSHLLGDHHFSCFQMRAQMQFSILFYFVISLLHRI